MQSIIQKIKIILRAIIYHFISFIAYLLISKQRRKKDTVVCGGWAGHRFADNSKAMFVFLSSNKEKLGLKKVRYVTKNRNLFLQLQEAGVDILFSRCLKSLLFQTKSYYHLVDCSGSDIDGVCSQGAIRINLWHGFPLKKIRALATKAENNILRYSSFVRKSELGGWYNYINIATSKKQQELQARAFMIDKRQILLGAYPRIVYMLGNIPRFYLSKELKALNAIKKTIVKKKKIIGYFPTFRDDIKSNNICLKTIGQLDEFAKTNNCLIVTKLHFVTRNLERIEYTNVVNLPPEADLYNFLDLTDMLITDYSSVYFDYMVLNRPIMFYCFDYDYYANEDRGFFFDYNNFAPGAKAQDFETLSGYILEAIADPEHYKEKFKDIYNDVMDVVFDGEPKTTEKDLFDLWEGLKKMTYVKDVKS